MGSSGAFHMSEPSRDAGPGPSLTRAATILCGLGAMAGVVLLLLALYRFRFSLSGGALAWYAIAATVIGVAVLLLRASATARVTGAVLGIGALILLFGIELAIELYERSQFLGMQQAVARHTGVPFDRRTVRQVVQDLRRDGTPAVASIVPRVLLPFTLGEASPESEFRAPFFPLAGISRRPTLQLCAEGGRYPMYESDEYGFLNPPGSRIAASNLVVLIGDSFTHGYCVPADSNVAAHLRRTWPHVVSLGTGGSGSLAELATLTEYAAPLSPALVLWIYSENDLPDLALERRNATLMKYLDRGFCQNLRRRQPQIDSALSTWMDRLYEADAEPQWWGTYGWRQTLVLAALRNRIAAARRVGVPQPMVQLQLFDRVLREAAARVDAWGGRMVFVFLPAWERLFQPEVAAADSTRSAVLDRARAANLTVVDLTPVFASHSNPAALYSRGRVASGHYSGAGYDLVARTITGVVALQPRPPVPVAASTTSTASSDASACAPGSR
jgi:hypothetical protein